MKALLAPLAILCMAPAPALAQSEEPADRFRTTQEQVEHDLPTQTPASRRTMAVFAACVVENDGAKAKALLARDIREKSYSDALKRLFDSNRDCVNKADHHSLSSGRLAFAGALAEQLIKRDEAALNVRLAKAAAGKPTETFGPVDQTAMCVAKSAPDEVGRMFATEPDSEAETAAANALAPALTACAQATGSPRIAATPFGLRSALASASYRLLAAQNT